MSVGKVGKVFMDFCQDSTIHGLSKVADSTQTKAARITWFITIILSMVCATYIIYQSFKGKALQNSGAMIQCRGTCGTVPLSSPRLPTSNIHTPKFVSQFLKLEPHEPNDLEMPLAHTPTPCPHPWSLPPSNFKCSIWPHA